MLVCRYGRMDGRKILCGRTNRICAHVKVCQLNGKWHQTDGARECERMQEVEHGERDDGKQG